MRSIKSLNRDISNDRLKERVPFAVVGSNTVIDSESGKKVRGRKYPWGVVDVSDELIYNDDCENAFFELPLYRASHVLQDLGWIDLDLGSSPGWWAATVATYCPSRVVEHPKSKSTKPSPR